MLMHPCRILLLLFLVATSDVATFPAIPLDDGGIFARDVQRLDISDEEISRFFWYYTERGSELKQMPQFYEGQEPDRDILTLFVWLCFWDEHPELEYGDGRVSAAQFEEVLKGYLPEVDYVHGDSGFFFYRDGYYIPDGFDTVDGNYYRLRVLNKKADGAYQAAFDVLTIGEMEYFDMDSPNMRAIYEYSEEVFGWDEETVNDDWPEKFLQTIEAIFLQEDYRDVLKMSGQAVIEFRLSSDPMRPIQYLSYKRTDPADGRGPRFWYDKRHQK